jgi:hypothetical protein
MVKYNAINPRSRNGGSMTSSKIPSEIARMTATPRINRVGMGVWERVVFIKWFATEITENLRIKSQ